jgi:hypothetical protein
MTFAETLTEVGQTLNYANGSAPPATQTRWLAYMNNRHREMLTKVTKLRDSNITLTTTSGLQQYSLPVSVNKVKDIYDPKTNMRKLVERDRMWVRTFDPRAEVTSFGPPSVWVDMGFVPWQTRISTASKMYAVSTSTDTGNLTIEYVRSGGFPGAAHANLTSTTPIQLGTDTDIIEITKMYLSAGANGFVSLKAANGTGTTISTLGPGQTFARYRSILLWPTPNSSNLVLSIDYTRQIPDATVNVNDESLLPPDWQWLLTLAVQMDEFKKMDDNRYATAKAEYEQGVKNMISDVLNNDDWIVIPGEPAPRFYPYKLPVGS